MADYAIVSIQCDSEMAEILMAEMTWIGYDSFQTTEFGFISSIGISEFSENYLNEIFTRYPKGKISWNMEESIKENWNKKWEENFPPVKIGKEILIRAPFHEPDNSFAQEVIIMPKMSFGTGHHETTELMLTQMARLDFAEKTVLDAGCGTGILGIFAARLGAKKVVACDIEEWAFENSIENYQLNNQTAEIYRGSIEMLPEVYYQIILANINKNVLMEQINYYSNHLETGGELLLSGFYSKDIAELEKMCALNSLKKEAEDLKNNWALLILKKQI